MHGGGPTRTHMSWNTRNRRTLRPLSPALAGTGQGAVSGTLRAVVADRRLPTPRTLRADRRLQNGQPRRARCRTGRIFLPACWRPTCRMVADYDVRGCRACTLAFHKTRCWQQFARWERGHRTGTPASYSVAVVIRTGGRVDTYLPYLCWKTRVIGLCSGLTTLTVMVPSVARV